MKRFPYFFLVLAILILVIFPLRILHCAYAQEQKTASPEKQPTLDQMLGAMLMLGFRESSLNANNPFLKMIKNGQIGNVILFDRDVTENKPRNIISSEQLQKLTTTLKTAAPHPMFIAVDQEGGQVRRLKPQNGFSDLPSAQALGQGNPAATLQTAEKLGAELFKLGINLDMAPVVDVDTNPFNPAIGRLGRAFNTDPNIVAQHALAFGQGLAKNGVTPCLKHFPGQGCATEDSHLGVTDISQCWKADTDLLPYAEIFRQGWPGMVMIGHLINNTLDNAQPATLSRKIVTGLLRDGLGWKGVVISDDLQMKGVAQGKELKDIFKGAIEAGIDILLLGNNQEWDEELPNKAFTALRSLVDEGIISENRIRESWERIMALHSAYGQTE